MVRRVHGSAGPWFSPSTVDVPLAPSEPALDD